MAYYLSYYNDTLAAGASLTFPKDAIHRLFYIHQGKAEIDGQPVAADEAVYRHGSATVTRRRRRPRIPLGARHLRRQSARQC